MRIDIKLWAKKVSLTPPLPARDLAQRRFDRVVRLINSQSKFKIKTEVTGSKWTTAALFIFAPGGTLPHYATE